MGWYLLWLTLGVNIAVLFDGLFGLSSKYPDIKEVVLEVDPSVFLPKWLDNYYLGVIVIR